MPKSDAQELGEWQAGVERKLEDLARNRLSNASLDGTTLWLKDAYGNRQASLGAQGDGSSGVRVVKVQPPPQLTAAILTVGDQAGTCLCEWDGNTFDGRIMPLIHGHTEIWALHVGEDWDPTVAPPDGAKRVGTIRDRTGGEVVIALPQFGIWAVWLRAMGADRETAGPWSPVATVEITGNVDVEAIEQELQDARDRLEAAEAKAADAIQRVTDLGEQWDEADFPQLKADLEQAQQAVADAEDRLDAAEQGVSESQAGLIDLRDVRLPALRGDLDSIESAVADYDQRIIAAQAGADQANATAENLRDNVLPPLQGDLEDLTENRLPEVESTLDDTRLGMENLRDIQLPDLDDQLRSGIMDVADSYERLAIGDMTNRIHDPDFKELPEDGILPHAASGGSAWARPSDSNPTWFSTSEAGRRFMRIEDDGSGTQKRVGYYGPGGRRIRVEPSETFLLTFRGWRSTSGGQVLVRARFTDVNGDDISSHGWPTLAQMTNSGVQDFSSELTVPDNSQIRGMWLDFLAQYNSGMTGSAWVEVPYLRRMFGGELIVDGSISARHIMAESIAAAVAEFLYIEADNINTEGLAAYLATIIELDAGQITAGKINTARLDAQEVAGAVANFLTLDALEINVEELAGQIANIIEITAESIASGAISARHLAIADFDNLITDEDLEDFSAQGFSSQQWSATASPGNNWTIIRNQSSSPILLRYTSNRQGGGPGGRASFRKAGQGIPVRPGDQFFLRLEGWTSVAAQGSLQIQARYGDADLGYVTRATHATITASSQDISWTVPNTASIRFMDVEFNATSSATGNAHWAITSFRRKSGGELIVDGSIRARHIVAEEIAAAVAQFLELHASQITAGTIDADLLNVSDLAARIANVIQLNASRITTGQLSAARLDIVSLFANTGFVNSLAARVIETLQVTAERGFIGGALLEDSTITVEKLYALDEIMSELGRFLRIEAGSLASNDIEAMRIVSSLIEATTYLIHNADGDVSVRLDGMDNYFAGSLHAGVGGDSEIHLDYGAKTRRRGISDEGEPDETWTTQTPYIDFHSDWEYQQDLRPSIYLDDVEPNGRSDRAGMMVVNPGYRPDTPRFRGKFNVVGDVQANRVEPRERLQVNTSLSDQPGVIQSIGQGVRIRGQVPALTHSQEMFYTGQTDQASLAPGGLRKRTLSWGVPVPRGRRDPIVTVYMAAVPSDNNAYVVANVSNRFTNSYRIDEYNPSSATANYWVGVIGPWRDV